MMKKSQNYRMKLILSKASQELRVDRNCQFLLLTGKLQRNTHKEKNGYWIWYMCWYQVLNLFSFKGVQLLNFSLVMTSTSANDLNVFLCVDWKC